MEDGLRASGFYRGGDADGEDPLRQSTCDENWFVGGQCDDDYDDDIREQQGASEDSSDGDEEGQELEVSAVPDTPSLGVSQPIDENCCSGSVPASAFCRSQNKMEPVIARAFEKIDVGVAAHFSMVLTAYNAIATSSHSTAEQLQEAHDILIGFVRKHAPVLDQ